MGRTSYPEGPTIVYGENEFSLPLGKIQSLQGSPNGHRTLSANHIGRRGPGRPRKYFQDFITVPTKILILTFTYSQSRSLR